MIDPILQELATIKNLISASESPRLSKEKACKFLGVGKPKLKMLYIKGKIHKYVDDWGEEYYLKSDLLEYLKSNQAEKLVKRSAA